MYRRGSKSDEWMCAVMRLKQKGLHVNEEDEAEQEASSDGEACAAWRKEMPSIFFPDCTN